MTHTHEDDSTDGDDADGPHRVEDADDASSLGTAEETGDTETDDGWDDESVTATALARRLRNGEAVSVLDLRDRDVVERWGVEGRSVTAAQVPHVRFVASHATGDVRDPLPDLPEPIVVVCARGEASGQVAGWLRETGIDARNLAGGTRAWAETVLAETLPAPDGVTVRQYQRPATGCLSYLVAADGEALVIDPLRAATDRLVADADRLGVTITAVVDTHVHADHVSGLRELATHTGARTILPAGVTDRGLGFEPDRGVGGGHGPDDGDAVSVGGETLSVLAAPGHTRESVALFGVGHLFAGDALFLRSVGRPDLVGGDDPESLAATAYRTLHDRLLALPDETVLAPGHAADVADARDGRYTAPMAEIRTLDVLGLDRAAFVDRVTDRLPPKPANHERIVAANLGRERLDDETAFESELGPNHCAVAEE